MSTKKPIIANEEMDFKKPQRVFVVDARYTESADLIECIVRFEDGKELVLAYPSGDIIAAYNIVGEVKPHHLVKFCSDIKGKFIKLTIEGRIKNNKSIKDMTTDQIDALNKELDQFPFGDVIGIMQDGKKE